MITTRNNGVREGAWTGLIISSQHPALLEQVAPGALAAFGLRKSFFHSSL